MNGLYLLYSPIFKFHCSPTYHVLLLGGKKDQRRFDQRKIYFSILNYSVPYFNFHVFVYVLSVYLWPYLPLAPTDKQGERDAIGGAMNSLHT